MALGVAIQPRSSGPARGSPLPPPPTVRTRARRKHRPARRMTLEGKLPALRGGGAAAAEAAKGSAPEAAPTRLTVRALQGSRRESWSPGDSAPPTCDRGPRRPGRRAHLPTPSPALPGRPGSAPGVRARFRVPRPRRRGSRPPPVARPHVHRPPSRGADPRGPALCPRLWHPDGPRGGGLASESASGRPAAGLVRTSAPPRRPRRRPCRCLRAARGRGGLRSPGRGRGGDGNLGNPRTPGIPKVRESRGSARARSDARNRRRGALQIREPSLKGP